MITIAEKSLRFAVNNQALSISKGNPIKLKEALRRLSGILPGSEITMEESKVLEFEVMKSSVLRELRAEAISKKDKKNENKNKNKNR